jgi:hypothetical protein
MKSTTKKFLFILLIIGLFLFGVGQLGWAEKWQPYQFKGDERFEYKILWNENEEPVEITYILDIKIDPEKSQEGEEIYEVSYTTKGTLTKDELGQETAFGLGGAYGISLNMLVINPAYGFFFSQIDLKVGEKMNFFGAGIVKVTAMEEIAGRSGFVCQLFSPEEEDKMLAEWVIDPELALPLRSKTYGDNGIEGEIELLNYTQY